MHGVFGGLIARQYAIVLCENLIGGSFMCVLSLAEKDRIQIRFFRDQAGVLLDVHPHLIDQSNGAIVVACSDGDQMPDVFKHHEKICAHHREHSRIHLFALNGGAKLISENSPLRMYQEDEVLLSHIRVAREKKNIDTVVLYAHAPCAVAYDKKLSFAEVLELLFQGKERVKREIPGVKVACFCHVDHGDGKKRTYFVSCKAWSKLRETESMIKTLRHA